MGGHGKMERKVHTVMAEYKRGTLHSGSGAKVRKRAQAIAIAMSESGQARRKRPAMARFR